MGNFSCIFLPSCGRATPRGRLVREVAPIRLGSTPHVEPVGQKVRGRNVILWNLPQTFAMAQYLLSLFVEAQQWHAHRSPSARRRTVQRHISHAVHGRTRDGWQRSDRGNTAFYLVDDLRTLAPVRAFERSTGFLDVHLKSVSGTRYRTVLSNPQRVDQWLPSEGTAWT